MCHLLFVRTFLCRSFGLVIDRDVECSIISVMDGSLPKKPCKTCKNRFHAACLYKVSLALFDLLRPSRVQFGADLFRL